MSEFKDKQDEKLSYMADVMSLVEKEKFTVRKIDIYSPFLALAGKKWYTGSLVIVGNEEYMKNFNGKRIEMPKHVSMDDKIVELDYNGYVDDFVHDDGKKKAIILQYNDKKEGYDFEKVVNKSSYEDNYYYLNDAMDLLETFENPEAVLNIMKSDPRFISHNSAYTSDGYADNMVENLNGGRKK